MADLFSYSGFHCPVYQKARALAALKYLQFLFAVDLFNCFSFLLFSLVNRVCPRCSCFAVSNVLAAYLHPCAAPASSGLLLVRPVTSIQTHACTCTHAHRAKYRVGHHASLLSAVISSLSSGTHPNGLKRCNVSPSAFMPHRVHLL